MSNGFEKYRDNPYIDEIYVYSLDSYKMVRQLPGGYPAGLLMSFLLFLLNLPFRIDEHPRSEIGITRNKLHEKILNKAVEGLPLLNDDIKRKSFEIFRIGSRFDRLRFIFTDLIRLCRQDRREIKKILAGMESLSEEKRKALLRFFKQRIAHTRCFEWSLKRYLEAVAPQRVYVSYTLDRFALVTEKVCKEAGIELVCIPHGEIENTQLPRRYPGDKVYLLNEQLCRRFNEAYQTDAYVYDRELLKRIYKASRTDFSGGKVVYLMTPFFHVEEQLALIERLAQRAAAHNAKIYVKQHPVQRYPLAQNGAVEELVSLDEAICRNLCIGYFTTALIDAVFNDSKAISVLRLIDDKTIYEKNKDVFEGCGIDCVESEEKLLETVEKYLEGKER